jgi:hypothetical protein
VTQESHRPLSSARCSDLHVPTTLSMSQHTTGYSTLQTASNLQSLQIDPCFGGNLGAGAGGGGAGTGAPPGLMKALNRASNWQPAGLHDERRKHCPGPPPRAAVAFELITMQWHAGDASQCASHCCTVISVWFPPSITRPPAPGQQFLLWCSVYLPTFGPRSSSSVFAPTGCNLSAVATVTETVCEQLPIAPSEQLPYTLSQAGTPLHCACTPFSNSSGFVENAAAAGPDRFAGLAKTSSGRSRRCTVTT